MPELVVVSSEVDDVASCQLLSMLKADCRLSGIPVLTCPPVHEQPDLDDDLSELDQDTSTRAFAAAMN